MYVLNCIFSNVGANLSLLLEDVIWDDEENFRTTRVREGIHFVAGDLERQYRSMQVSVSK